MSAIIPAVRPLIKIPDEKNEARCLTVAGLLSWAGDELEKCVPNAGCSLGQENALGPHRRHPAGDGQSFASPMSHPCRVDSPIVAGNPWKSTVAVCNMVRHEIGYGCPYLTVKTLIFLEKIWCPEADSNHRHADFQSAALPTELPGRKFKHFAIA